MSKILIEKVETEYQLTSKKHTMNVVIDEKTKRISLWPFTGERSNNFIFKDSKVEDIESIARLMLKAIKIIK